MDYPHGHHRPDPRDEEYQYPPPGRSHAPPHYGVNEPPPPQVYHSSHSGPGPDSYHPPPPGRPHGLSPYGVNEPPPPQSYHTSHSGPGPDSYHGPPPPQAYHNSQFGSGPEAYHPPPPPQEYHTSHSGPGPEMYQPPPQAYHTSHSGPGHSPPRNPGYGPPPPHAVEKPHQQPHMPAIFDHQSGHKEAEWTKKASVRMYTKAENNYSLTIRDGKVILVRSDPSDPYQQWVRDEKFSTKVKDEEGFPSFALVNKATGQAMKHSIGATHPVQLIPYNPDVLDESILWTESRDLGDTYRTIRMVNNIRLNVDALNGDKNHGGVRDGTTIVLWEWKKGDNQRWKIVRHCKHYTKISV